MELGYGLFLPQEAAETVALYKRLMAEPSPLETPEWKSQSDLEQKEGLLKYREFLDMAQEITDREAELKAHLWWQWTGRAALVVVAVLGWLHLAKLPAFRESSLHSLREFLSWGRLSFTGLSIPTLFNHG